MTRALLTAAVMLGPVILGAGAPGCGVGLAAQVSSKDFPVPPIPPDHPSLAETAPVPNADAQAPAAPQSTSPSVDVKLYRTRPYDPGYGFAPGSRYQDNEERKPIQTPGLVISVPIQ